MTSGGVGYKVYSNINTLLSKDIGENIDMYIFTVVKDDAIDLYGFLDKDELYLFEKLISVSGVGPKSALNVLSIYSVSNIAIAIEDGNANALSGIPGLGKKGCEKIIIELKGKLSKLIKDKISSGNGVYAEEEDAKLAMISLGYNEKDVNIIINKMKENESFKDMKATAIIKEALKALR